MHPSCGIDITNSLHPSGLAPTATSFPSFQHVSEYVCSLCNLAFEAIHHVQQVVNLPAPLRTRVSSTRCKQLPKHVCCIFFTRKTSGKMFSRTVCFPTRPSHSFRLGILHEAVPKHVFTRAIHLAKYMSACTVRTKSNVIENNAFVYNLCSEHQALAHMLSHVLCILSPIAHVLRVYMPSDEIGNHPWRALAEKTTISKESKYLSRERKVHNSAQTHRLAEGISGYIG